MAATNVIFDPTGQAKSLLGNYKHVGLQAPADADVLASWADVVTAFATIEQTGGGIYIPDWVAADIDQGLQFTRAVNSSSKPVVIQAIGPGRPTLNMTGTFAFLNQASYGENYPVGHLTLRQLSVRGTGAYGSHFARLGAGGNRVVEDCMVQSCAHGYTDQTSYPLTNIVIRRNRFIDTSYAVWTGATNLEISDNVMIRSPFEHCCRVRYAINGNITRNVFIEPEDAEPEDRGHALTVRCSPEFGLRTDNVYVTNNIFKGGDWALQIGYIDFLSKNVNPAYWGRVVVAHNQWWHDSGTVEQFVAHADVDLLARCNTSPTGPVDPWRYVYDETGHAVDA